MRLFRHDYVTIEYTKRRCFIINTGEILKQKRLEKSLTLEEVGNLVGVGKSTVRKWENGLIENMGRDKIVKLSKALDVSPLLLLGIEESPKSSIETIYNQLTPPRQQKVYDFADSQLKEQRREEQLSNLDERTLRNLHRYAEEFGIDALDDLFEEMLAETKSDEDSVNHEAG